MITAFSFAAGTAVNKHKQWCKCAENALKQNHEKKFNAHFGIS